jgi:hypothetical protein
MKLAFEKVSGACKETMDCVLSTKDWIIDSERWKVEEEISIWVNNTLFFLILCYGLISYGASHLTNSALTS